MTDTSTGGTYRLSCNECDWQDTAESKGRGLDKRITHEILRNREGGPEHVTRWSLHTETEQYLKDE